MAPSRDDICVPAVTAKSQHGSGHLLHRSLAQKPAMVESASGIELKLASGQIVIDACGGAAVALIGHGNEEVTQAMVGQARKVSYVHTQAYTTAPAEELADIILKGNPYGLEKAFFVGSGSEAVESALKLARQYFYEKNEPKRVHLISRQQSYHGNTMAAMSISTNQARKAPYQGFCYPNVSHVSPAYAYQYKLDTESEAEFTERLLAELDAEMLRVGPETVAAFIAETVSGATLGCVAAPEGYFRGVRGLCDKYGMLLFLDEIMCGVGRTGTYFAFEQEGVVPDVVTIAKGLGGGYAAIAGVVMHGRVVDALRQGSQVFNSGHTYQAHPISCAAALAVQRIVQRDGLVARCAELGRCLGRLLREGLREGLRGCRSVGDIRGRGLFWGVEFVSDRASRQPLDPLARFGVRVQQIAFAKGVALLCIPGLAPSMASAAIMSWWRRPLL
ncbi:putative aminotransferase [Neonectria ditissima]|uniref:Putative aminotransferase n=1 Tax=Neonectria ditissima TaxID=78410 RepID=A0A0P7BVQ5_9HYPO|nr:putative aminotransferase [Neonectria ditissima]